MSVAERPRGSRLAGDERTLSGWGRTGASRALVCTPLAGADVAETLSEGSSHGVIARGAGRSYGDAAQCRGGTVLDMRAMAGISAIDPARRTVTARAGTTIAQILAGLASHSLTLPVLPGTRHVTLAGAIASDIHGKSHHHDGALARHVREISLCKPSGEIVRVDAESDPQLFFATLGGMGLTGVILAATLQAISLPHPWLLEDSKRTSGLEQTLELLGGSEPHRYSVAWLDMLAPGASMGRGVLSAADPAGEDFDPPPRRRWPGAGGRSYPLSLSRPPVVGVSRTPSRGLLGVGAVRAFNAARWLAAPRSRQGHPVPYAPYFFPLDVVGDWNRLYGRGGLIQYQFVIPAGGESELRLCFEVLRGLPVYLAVFKRFGPAFGGPLSFPREGWTLAVDLPAAAEGVHASLDRLDDIVAACGGRVYLTKDSRLRREHLSTMYPELPSFLALRERVDPGELLRSDLGSRLGLCRVCA